MSAAEPPPAPAALRELRAAAAGRAFALPAYFAWPRAALLRRLPRAAPAGLARVRLLAQPGAALEAIAARAASGAAARAAARFAARLALLLGGRPSAAEALRRDAAGNAHFRAALARGLYAVGYSRLRALDALLLAQLRTALRAACALAGERAAPGETVALLRALMDCPGLAGEGAGECGVEFGAGVGVGVEVSADVGIGTNADLEAGLEMLRAGVLRPGMLKIRVPGAERELGAETWTQGDVFGASGAVSRAVEVVEAEEVVEAIGARGGAAETTDAAAPERPAQTPEPARMPSPPFRFERDTAARLAAQKDFVRRYREAQAAQRRYVRERRAAAAEPACYTTPEYFYDTLGGAP